MRVHHLTAKKAASLGIEFADCDTHVSATHIESGIVAYSASAPDALAAAADCAAELEKGKWFVTQTEFEGDFTAQAAKKGKPHGDIVACDPDLADLFLSLDEMEPEEDDDESPSGSVVPNRYKQMYKEAHGDPTHCGDWLALTLNTLCHVNGDKGKKVTDMDRFMKIAVANGIEQEYLNKLNSGTRGWEGRMRMTVRNKLVKLIVEAEVLIDHEGKEHKPNPAWMAKHKEAIAQREANKAAKKKTKTPA